MPFFNRDEPPLNIHDPANLGGGGASGGIGGYTYNPYTGQITWVPSSGDSSGGGGGPSFGGYNSGATTGATTGTTTSEGAFGPGGYIDPSSGTYATNPSVGAAGTDSTGGSSIWSKLGGLFGAGGGSNNKYLKGLQLLYGIYQDQRKPRYSQPPMSPEQRQLYQMYIDSLKNPALAGISTDTSNYARSMLNSMHPSWQSPKTFSGDVGYGGYGGNPNQPHMPLFDWHQYLQQQNPQQGNPAAGAPPPPVQPMG